MGHARIAARQKGTEPVSKITIVPHTQGALGYTMQTPEEEKFLNSKDELYSRIRLTRHDWETGTDEVLETLEF